MLGTGLGLMCKSSSGVACIRLGIRAHPELHCQLKLCHWGLMQLGEVQSLLALGISEE